MLPIQALSQTYEYVNLFNSRHTISIQLSPAFFASGDRAIDAKFCSRSDFFVCITSDEFNFAIPVSMRSNDSQWEYKGFSYELKQQDILNVLGQSLKVLIIESVQGAKKIRFLYSERRGLVAFSVEMNGESHTFLSRNTVGFGDSVSRKRGSPRRAQPVTRKADSP